MASEVRAGVSRVQTPKTGASATSSGLRTVHLREPAELGPIARQTFAGRTGVATAGYSAPPAGTPYEQNTARFLESFTEAVQGRVGFVTSPTASAGSIDALTTVAAHQAEAPVVYVTAESYLEYIKPEEFPPGVDRARFQQTPAHYYSGAADYSRATAAGSDALLVTGGRDTTVSDFVNAIEKGNKVVILADREVVTRDADGKVQEFDAKGRVSNASLYLEGVVRALAKGESPRFRELPGVGFDQAWVRKNRDRLLSNVLVVDGADPAAAGEKAAGFVRAGTHALGSVKALDVAQSFTQRFGPDATSSAELPPPQAGDLWG